MDIAITAAGLHPTTESCLEALQWLHERREFHNVLDMGCGNGILSVASAGIWQAPILAVDVSEKAVQDTQGMVDKHQLQSLVTVAHSNGFSNPLIKNNSPYDLILFNLLAEPIVQMASAVNNHIAPNGVIVLSGILAWLEESVINTYTALGFVFIHEIVNNPWRTHIACHKEKTEKS
jgi:ribosomal protein L11 methyltransferase